MAILKLMIVIIKGMTVLEGKLSVLNMIENMIFIIRVLHVREWKRHNKTLF
jgi:hypothetical protein